MGDPSSRLFHALRALLGALGRRIDRSLLPRSLPEFKSIKTIEAPNAVANNKPSTTAAWRARFNRPFIVAPLNPRDVISRFTQ
jgi:hypothetical protein